MSIKGGYTFYGNVVFENWRQLRNRAEIKSSKLLKELRKCKNVTIKIEYKYADDPLYYPDILIDFTIND